MLLSNWQCDQDLMDATVEWWYSMFDWVECTVRDVAVRCGNDEIVEMIDRRPMQIESVQESV